VQAKREKLDGPAAVKGTLVQAHLRWAEEQIADARTQLVPQLEGQCRDLVIRGILATDWIPLRCLVQIDRALAQMTDLEAETAFAAMGRHSAEQNLRGVYRNFVAQEPHQFFEQMSFLHRRFMNFGRSTYEQTGERSGRVRLEEYVEYSPVVCASGRGYYEGALKTMKVPGPIRVEERTCQCAGDPACVYELAW
jgi:uncharacterized protein (TIGR02265 family)